MVVSADNDQNKIVKANNDIKPTKKTRKKHKPLTPYTIIFFILVFVVALTWILDWTNVSVSGPDGTTYQVTGAGILDIFTSPFEAFVKKSNILIFILSVGAFSFIVMESKSLEAVTQRIVKKMGDHAIWIIPIMTIMFSFFGSTYGMCEESLGFLFVLCPLMLASGFDVITAVLIIVMGVDLGTMMATTDPFLITPAVSATNDALNQQVVTFSDGIGYRLIAWLIVTIFSCCYITFYGLRVKKNPKRSVAFNDLEGHKTFFLHEAVTQIEFTKKRVIIAVIYLLTFLVMITYLVSWDGLLGKGDIFDGNNADAYTTRYAAGDTPLPDGWATPSDYFNSLSSSQIAELSKLGITQDSFKLVNDPSSFGPMQRAQIYMLNHFPYFAGFTPGLGLGDLYYVAGIFFIASLVVGALTWAGEAKFSETLVNGARDVLGVIFMISLAGGINVIFDHSNLSQVAANGLKLSGMNPYLFISLTFLAFVPISFAIPSTSGFSTAIFPIWGPVSNNIVLAKGVTAASGSITAFSYANGWANLFSPATGLIMGACSIARISYVQFLKAIWPVIVITFFLDLLLLIGGTGIDISSGLHLF